MNEQSSEVKRLVFTGKQEVSLETFHLAQPSPGEVRVRVEVSLMSTGTENIVFNRLFDPGTHWDNWVKYPFHPGYSAVGVIEEAGAEVKELQPGMRVACRAQHCSLANVPAAECSIIPQGISWEAAAWCALAKIAFHGVKAADLRLGDSVLVVGAGPIGQMAIRWTRASGAKSIVVVDPVKGRLQLAEAGGATATCSQPIAEAREAVLAANGGKLPRVVIDSTGHPKVFSAALSLAEQFGTVLILGDTGTPGQQCLTGDVVTRGLHLVGAHDSHNDGKWNQRTISDLFFTLMADGRFSTRGLDSHRFKPEDCREAYAVANRDRASTMGILFEWR